MRDMTLYYFYRYKMRLIGSDNLRTEISDLLILESPLLSLMTEPTYKTIPIEKIEEYVRIPYPTHMIDLYGLFLAGYSIDVDDSMAELLEYMGHINDLGYPSDYWGIKLHDNWIRNHMYSLELWKDPHHDLQKVPRVREIVNSPLPRDHEGLVVAGGYAMWLAGWIDNYHDIDIFVMNRRKAAKLIATYDFVELATNAVTLSHYNIDFMKRDENDLKVSVQVILRLYKAPTEIVHGFDLDCVGILWDGQDLWATKRAIYAYEHRVNWFDPARASPSYAYRLSKYRMRGYDIGLPRFDPERINLDAIHNLYVSILDLYVQVLLSHTIDSGNFTMYGHELVEPARALTSILLESNLRNQLVASRDIRGLMDSLVHVKSKMNPCEPSMISIGHMLRVLRGSRHRK